MTLIIFLIPFHRHGILIRCFENVFYEYVDTFFIKCKVFIVELDFFNVLNNIMKFSIKSDIHGP